MIIDIIGIIAGVYLVLRGADKLTDGAVSIAQRLNMSEMVIGLTVVALGTSMPELSISLTSALQGMTNGVANADMAVANVVGSNIFNVLLIGGLSAAVAPMMIKKGTVKRDIPVAIGASFLLLVCGFLHEVNRWMGLCFLAFLLLYMFFAVKSASAEDAEGVEDKGFTWMKALLLFVFGLAMLIVGSQIFVTCATSVAHSLGVSEAVIGLTIVAGGTSLPELATSIVAAKKGQSAIAMGNILGSCVYNILLIIGVTGLIVPLEIEGITYVDFGMMALSIVLLWLFSFTKYKLERWEGIVLVAIFVGYMAYLIANI